jgi:hypothetical protein
MPRDQMQQAVACCETKWSCRLPWGSVHLSGGSFRLYVVRLLGVPCIAREGARTQRERKVLAAPSSPLTKTDLESRTLVLAFCTVVVGVWPSTSRRGSSYG